jgi:hypothetical protein
MGPALTLVRNEPSTPRRTGSPSTSRLALEDVLPLRGTEKLNGANGVVAEMLGGRRMTRTSQIAP